MGKMIWLNRTLVAMPGYYGLCTSREAFEKTMRRLKIPKGDRPEVHGSAHADATMHTFYQGGKICCIVYMPLEHAKKHSREECYGLLIHEGVHIWQKVREHYGERDPSKEFEAYSVQMITQELIFAWKDATTKPKSKPKKLTMKKR